MSDRDDTDRQFRTAINRTWGTHRCVVCGEQGEVSHPDGKGDQVVYCGIHEPVEDGSVGR